MERPTIYFTQKKIYYIVTLLIIIAIIVLLPSKAILKVMNVIRIKPLNNITIVLDPGHGGVDGGTSYGDILEKNINLIIGLKLNEELTKKGATVVMTREIDNSLDDRIVGNGSRHREDLNARVKIANDNKADIFISIHVNHTKNTSKMGPIIFYDIDSENGKFLAEYVQTRLNNLSAYKEMDVKVKHSPTSGNYFTLKNISSPGVIVETGFISNENDRKLLLDVEHQNEMIELIARSIIDYFNEIR